MCAPVGSYYTANSCILTSRTQQIGWTQAGFEAGQNIRLQKTVCTRFRRFVWKPDFLN